MMERETFKIEGIEAAMETLQALPSRVSAKLIKPAMQEAGNMLSMNLRGKAYKVLAAAQMRGYKRKPGTRHLYATATARAKTYRSGNTTFVAVGFAYAEGGYHGHLVEYGHRIVRGGTLDQAGQRSPDITAAGHRFLKAMGFVKNTVKGTRRNKFPWIGPSGEPTKVGMFVGNQRVRGGGQVIRGKSGKFTTGERPMLRPAFAEMKRPMLIAIENELKKIGPEAEQLARGAKR